MTRLARIGIVLATSASLFLVGGLGLFLRSDAQPTADPAPVPDANALLGSGGNGSLDGSIASLQGRVREVPGDWRASAGLGLAYVQQGRITADPSYYPKAEGVLQASLTQRPGNAEALLGLGALAAARHDFDGALRYGRRARGLNPYDASAHGVVGDALLELGRYDDAFASFQTMMDIRPDSASFARVSYALQLRGDLSGAIAAMQRALGYAGTPADAAWSSYQLGELYLADGRRSARGLTASAAVPTWTGPLHRVVRGAGDRVVPARGDLTGADPRGWRRSSIASPSPGYVIALGDLHALAGHAALAERQYELARIESELFGANRGERRSRALPSSTPTTATRSEALEAAEAEWAKRRSIHVADALAWALHANGRSTMKLPATHARPSRSARVMASSCTTPG